LVILVSMVGSVARVGCRLDRVKSHDLPRHRRKRGRLMFGFTAPLHRRPTPKVCVWIGCRRKVVTDSCWCDSHLDVLVSRFQAAAADEARAQREARRT
jgi:hypothetical protein